MATIHVGSIQADVGQTSFCALPSATQGIGTVTYDDVNHVITWSYTYGDNAPDFDDGRLFNDGTENTAHFHGPAPPSVHAPVVLSLATAIFCLTEGVLGEPGTAKRPRESKAIV